MVGIREDRRDVRGELLCDAGPPGARSRRLGAIAHGWNEGFVLVP
jgi:hypothetical protein